MAYRTTKAELFYLHHLRSRAASALGSRSTSSSGNTTVSVPSQLLDLACMCDGFVRWAAQAYEKAACIYSFCCLCGPGTMRWQTAVALANGHPVLATALFEALTLSQPFETFASGALRLACAYAALISIALGIHAPRLWQCRAISAFFSAGLCSESLLSAAISAMHSWDYPAFPPKLTPERIQEKLVELRAYVEGHVDVMRSRPGASVLEKLRQTVSNEEKRWHNFLTKTTKSFSAAHTAHLAATYNLISDAPSSQPVDSSVAGRVSETAPEELATQASVDASAKDAYSDYAGQPAFTSSGKLQRGGLEKSLEGESVMVRWRRRLKGAPAICTPRRDTVDEALQDYIHCFRAQEGLDDATAQIQAMRTAAEELHLHVLGQVLERQGVYCWRIRGKYAVDGPRRLTLEEATKDAADVRKVVSTATSEREMRKLARDALRSLCKEQTEAEKDKVRAAARRFNQGAKQLALSQASREYAVPLSVSLELNRFHHLVRECARIPELHDLRWDPVSDIVPQPYGRSANGPFPGLRNLGNSCFLNAVIQCFVHVSSLRQRLHAPDVILPLLPRQELAFVDGEIRT